MQPVEESGRRRKGVSLGYMGIHVFRCTQLVPVPRDRCWSFFSDPRNLEKITPRALDFRVLSELPAAIRPGLMIEYRVRPLLGIPMTWLTEITHVRESESFVDEQRVGPYAVWHHEHFFRDARAGCTEIEDLVHYVPPFGPLGEIVHPFLIAPELRKIFAFREQAVRQLFGEVQVP